MVDRSLDSPLSDQQLSRRGFLALAGLTSLGGLSTAVADLPSAMRPRALAPFEARTPWVPPVSAQADVPPWRGNPDATLANYRAAIAALAAGVAPRDLPVLAAFLEGDLATLKPLAAYRRLVGTVFSPDIFHEYAADMLRSTVHEARRSATTRAATLAWNGGEVSEATVVAYRRTGELRFLDLLVDYFDDVLRLRDSSRRLRDDRLGRALPTWGDGRLEPGRWIAHVTTAARICYAPTELARLTIRDPRLKRYEVVGRQYVGATERALGVFDGDFRRVPGTDASYYRIPAADRWEPINHAHQVGRVLLNLHDVTRDARYARRAAAIADVFVRSVRRDRAGNPYWRYFPFFEPKGAEDRAEPIWKASATVPFVYQAAERGQLDANLVDAAARSLADRIIRNGELNRTIDPVRFDPLVEDDAHSSRAAWVAAWLELAPLRPRIFDQVLELLVAHRRDYFDGAWFRRPSLARGYAYCLGDGIPGSFEGDP
jgi:hypothetical protein